MPIVSQFKSLHACLAQRTATWLLLVQIGHARMMYSTSFLNRDPLKNTPSQGEYTDFMDSYILHVSASCFSDPLHHPRLATIPRAEAIAEGVALPPASQRNWQILHLSLTCHWPVTGPRPWRLCCSTHRHLCRTWNMVELSSGGSKGQSAIAWVKICQNGWAPRIFANAVLSGYYRQGEPKMSHRDPATIAEDKSSGCAILCDKPQWSRPRRFQTSECGDNDHCIWRRHVYIYILQLYAFLEACEGGTCQASSMFLFCRIMPAFKEWCVRNPWEDLMSPASCLRNTARMSRRLRSQGPSRHCMDFFHLNISPVSEKHPCFESTSVGPMWILSSGHGEAISLGHESFLRSSGESTGSGGHVPVIRHHVAWFAACSQQRSWPIFVHVHLVTVPRVDSPIGDYSGSEILFWLREFKISKLGTCTH